VTQYHPHVCGVAVAGLAAALVIAGCGAGAAHRQTHLPGAEPAVSPPLQRAPAGRIVRVGAAAEGIIAVPRAGVVAVAVRDPDRITLLSLSSGAVVRALRIAGPARHLALDGPRTLLVPEAPINRLLELDLTRAAAPAGRRTIVTGSLPHDAAAAGGRVFVADEFGRAVTVITPGRPSRRIGGFTQPGGIATVAGRVALVDVGADTVSLIDPRSRRVIARARAGAGPTHDVAGPRARLYVADTRGDALLQFATRPRLRLVDRLALPGTPYGIASDPRRGRLWVTLTATNTLVELDDRTPALRVLARYPTVRQPNSVAVDPATGAVYVAGADAGVVEEISARPGPS
jgi:hypothetical protein